MKLLMISGDRSILQGKRGAFWYTLEEFSKHWERIDVICPHVRRQKAEGSDQYPHVHFHSSPWSLIWQPWWIVKKGCALISEQRHDVMTVHEYPPFYNGIGASKLHKKTGIPYALEIHHIVGYPVASSCAEWMGRMLSRLCLKADAKHAAAVRVVNHVVKQTLGAWGIPQQKIHVVPSFYLDAEILKPDSSAEKKCDLVFCARLVANKGLSDVLGALARIPAATLLVIGDGPERLTLERTVLRLGLAKRVTFAGWLATQEEVLEAMQSGRIFLMNSKSEGGPRVALEAMALGLPVLCTRVGVMPDVITDGENGIFTDGTPEDLAQKIKALLDDSELREKLGREARKITERFERKALMKNYADFLQRIG